MTITFSKEGSDVQLNWLTPNIMITVTGRTKHITKRVMPQYITIYIGETPKWAVAAQSTQVPQFDTCH